MAQLAIDVARPGEIIELADRRYDGCSLNLDVDGTEADPITIRAATSCATGTCGVRMSGKSTRFTMNGSYWVVEGMLIEDIAVSSGPAIFELRAATHNTIRHNRLVNVVAPVVIRMSEASDHNTFERNEFAAPDCDSEALVHIRANGSEPSRFNVFRYNHFHDIECGSVIEPGLVLIRGAHMTSLGSIVESNLFENNRGVYHAKSNDNAFRHNTIIRSRSSTNIRGGSNNDIVGNWFSESGGITLRGPGGGRVLNNYLENIRDAGGGRSAIALGWGNVEFPDSATNTAWPARDYLIANNTVVGAATNSIGLDYNRLFEWPAGSGEIRDIPPERNTIVNNLVIASAGYGFAEAGAIDNTYLTNIVWAIGDADALDTSLAGWRVIDPELDDHGAEFPRWVVGASSQAVGAGTTLPDTARDIYGVERVTPTTVGAMSPNVTMPPFRPLAPRGRGPGIELRGRLRVSSSDRKQ